MAVRYMALSEDHLLKGVLIAAYKVAIDNEEFVQFFEKHGFGEVDPDQWYPAQDVMDVFTDMEAHAQGLLNFVSIGMAIGEHLAIPSSVDQHSPEAVLSYLAVAQTALARTSQPGYIHLECLSDTHYIIKFRGAGPDNYFYGILYSVSRRFVPPSAHITVQYPPGGRRHDNGDEYTAFDLSWE